MTSGEWNVPRHRSGGRKISYDGDVLEIEAAFLRRSNEVFDLKRSLARVTAERDAAIAKCANVTDGLEHNLWQDGMVAGDE